MREQKELRFKGKTPPEIKLNSSGQDYFFGTYGMKNLEKIHVPAGCYKVYAEAYGSRLSNGARIVEEGAEDYLIENGVLTAYTGNAEEVSVPEGVTEIGTGAFQNNRELEKSDPAGRNHKNWQLRIFRMYSTGNSVSSGQSARNRRIQLSKLRCPYG